MGLLRTSRRGVRHVTGRALAAGVLLACAVVAAACGTSNVTAAGNITGDWGGDHAGLAATPDSGVLEYDCATGRVVGPLRLASDGSISGVGTHTPGHGGPVRIDEVLPKRPASYSGYLAGDHLVLTVVMTDSNVTVGTFDLYRGRSPRVFKCL